MPSVKETQNAERPERTTPSADSGAGAAYWRSLGERDQSPPVLAGMGYEFEESNARQSLPRRDFLKMATAALAAAGLSLSGCRRWPEQEVRPHGRQPEGTMPGVAQYYATAYELGGVCTGILARGLDGRPIKIEGNELHPFSLGAADAFAQASVLELYDPDRSRRPVERKAGGAEADGRSWADFERFLKRQLATHKNDGGSGLAVLAQPTCGPTLLRLKTRFLQDFPKARWHAYEPLHRDHEIAGTRLAFGKALRPQYHLEKARVIVCFDADLLGLHPAHQRHARDWAAGRASGDSGSMNRLYVAEPTFSLTGSVADERLAVRPSRIALLVAWLLARHAGTPTGQGPPDEQLEPRERRWLEGLLMDLKVHRGAAVLAAGPSQSAQVHAMVHALNVALGSVGTTITYTNEPLGDDSGCIESIRELSTAMRNGRVATLLILGGNPVYDAPADLNFDPAGSAAHPVTSIHLSAYQDETSVRCRWHVPMAHYLECWGDGRAWDGAYSVQQPLILPLFDGKSPIELLGMCLGMQQSGMELVQETARELIGDASAAKWERLLHDGVLAGSAWAKLEARLSPTQGKLLDLPAPENIGTSGAALEALFAPDTSVYDGRFANNGWLQELPDPLTKLTWDNTALLSKADADALGVTTGDVVRIQSQGELEIPAYVMPGLAPGTVVLPLGYGRTHSGNIGRGVGANTYRLRTCTQSYVAAGVKLSRTGRRVELAMTQEHHLIDAVGMWGREQRVGARGRSGHLIRESSLRQYVRDPHVFAPHSHDASQLFESPSAFKDPHAWGMAIDLNKCIGCGACVVACQVENNIPVVGKEQVTKNREMHWLRIDRYFRGPVEDPDVVYAPMACAHCENAPCEQVCPVAATVHDAEGLNTMVYNRCVGTRYCSNNCPYKVRRFNYLDFHATDPRGRAKPWLGMPDRQQRDQVDQIKRMAFNPDVTVRMRGVMEKCTYCVQRIQAAKINAKTQHASGERPSGQLADGEVVTACQGACPTQAIVFGDLNDSKGQVAQAHRNPRAYVMLEELNLRVRTRYLAKLRNPADGAADEHR